MSQLNEVSSFIDEAGLFFLSTIDGDQPKCRPLRAHFLIGDKLYFAVGRFKDVFKQMDENPKVEIVAVKDGTFLRYWGRAQFEENYAIAEAVLDKMPQMRAIYTMEGDMKLEVFHLEDAHAELRTARGVEKTLEV